MHVNEHYIYFDIVTRKVLCLQCVELYVLIELDQHSLKSLFRRHSCAQVSLFCCVSSLLRAAMWRHARPKSTIVLIAATTHT